MVIPDKRYQKKRLEDAERALALAADFNVREGWSRERVHRFQRQKLNSLVRHAVKSSPFYRELYKSVRTDEPVHLEQLPVIDKKIMMENFDRCVTDPRLKINELYDYIEELTYDDYYLGEYRVLTTSGSSGLRGIFVFDRKAWSALIAGVNRVMSMIGIQASSRMKIASIGANSPLHLSYRRAVSMDFGVHEYQRLEARERIESLADALNVFQPGYLHAYASIAALLATDQLDGHLHIKPAIIVTSAEVLTDAMKEKIQKAWGVLPFNSYSSTEGVLAVECACHNGIHIFEDLGIVEVADENNRPVPDGTPGHKILFTNLYQYTQPIIRYEMSDMMAVSKERCPCGRSFMRIVEMEGRSDDILSLDRTGGGKYRCRRISFMGPWRHSAISENIR